MGNKEEYRFYKERGICPRCRKEKAVASGVCCFDCIEKKQEYDRMRYKKQLESDHKHREKKNARWAELCRQRREQGLCQRCGKRPAANNRVHCAMCLAKVRRYYNNTRTDIPRSERPSYGLCYICGDEVFEGYGLCEKHYTQYAKRMAKLPRSERHPWEDDNRIALGRRSDLR